LIRTYLDSGVLIAGIRGPRELARSTLVLLDDPEREFVASAFIRLEIIPKAIYHRKIDEIDFYHRYFNQVVAWADPIDELVAIAEQEAAAYGLNALDSLHVASAIVLNVDELVTTEGQRKPIHRVERVRVASL
jgi:predicted nucleic acid-binding protein